MNKQMSLEKSGDRLHELREELHGLVYTATEHFFRMGVIMKEIRDKELWKAGYQSFGSFYSDPEFSFKKSSVYHAIRFVEVFPDWKPLIDVPVSKLMLVAPHINEKNRDQMVEDARTLSASDLWHKLTTGEQRSAYGEMPKIFPCNVCHGVKGVSFDMLCHCGWTPGQIEIISKAIDKVEFGEI